MPADPIAAVKRELLVRLLDGWIPVALRRSRRATFAQVYTGSADSTAEAALRAFAGFSGLLRGRRTAVLTLAAELGDLPVRLGAAEAGLPAEVGVHLMPAGPDRLPLALKAAGAAGAPLLVYLDAGQGATVETRTLAALAADQPTELLLALGTSDRTGPDYRGVLGEAGFPLVSAVELVPDGGKAPELLVFATGSGKRLDAFKDAVWAVDAPAGVRYRDPGNARGPLLEISSRPQAEPLRRQLLDRLAAVGGCSVTELRQFTAAATVYRGADANQALAAMLATGQVVREPADGRLSGEVRISPALAGPSAA